MTAGALSSAEAAASVAGVGFTAAEAAASVAGVGSSAVGVSAAPAPTAWPAAAWSSAALIELGPADHAPPDLDARPRADFRWAPWVALVVALLLLAGSAPLPPPAFGPERIVKTGIADRMVVLDDRIYSVGAVGDGRRVSAYALPSGRLEWTAPLPPDGGARQVLRAGDALLVSLLSTLDEDGELIALDLASGRERWRAATGFVYATDARHALVLRRDFGTDALYLPARRVVSRVAATDPRTGETLWSHVIGSGARYEPVFAGPDLRWTVLVPSGSDTAEVRNADTGAVVASRKVAPAGTTVLDVKVLGRTLLIRYGGAGVVQPRVAAYDAASLTPQWTVDTSIRSFEPADCGPAVCFSSAGIVSARDLATGVELWRAPQGAMRAAGGRRLLSVSGDGGLAVVSPRTGESLYQAASWRPLGPTGTDWVVVRYVVGSPTGWIGLLDTDRLAIRTLGQVEGIIRDTCRLGAGSVVCDLVGGGAGVWPYRA